MFITWEIGATTTSDPAQITHLSWCGICLLHSYEMLAELQEYHAYGPLQSGGGYFFNTAPNAGISPFISFRSRFRQLAQRVEGSLFLEGMSRLMGGDTAAIGRRMFYTITLIMFPNYNFYISPAAFAEIGIRNSVAELFNRPNGTLWLIGITRTSADGRRNVAHAQVVLRVPQGLMFIPTNTPNITYDQYRNYLLNSIASDVEEAMNIITIDRTRAALRFYYMELLGPQPNILNFDLSNNNCMGLGNNRRGNLQLPISATINQCASGRCGLP